ncbi:ribonuclease H-like domain-containing protein [Mycena polygramma]|nr:ribonuclease H-like domain-containing protein [Mycena polygramma]
MKRALTTYPLATRAKRSRTSSPPTTEMDDKDASGTPVQLPDDTKGSEQAARQVEDELLKATPTAEYPTLHNVHYLTSEQAVNDVLKAVEDGVIGFDTEFMGRTQTDEESFIEELFTNVPGNKRSAIVAWHAAKLAGDEVFEVLWDNIGICIVQIARGEEVWLLNLNRIRALPAELSRVLASDDIVKVGVGISTDLPVLWLDLGCDLNNVVDCGLMAKLYFCEEYASSPYSNLSLQQSTSDVLGFTVAKDLQKSNWKGDENGDISEEQQKYAAIDAHAALNIYKKLLPALEGKARKLNVTIPDAWYRFNGRYGFTVRRKLTHKDKYAPWSTADCTWYYGGRFQGYFP